MSAAPYADFLARKSQLDSADGFAPDFLPEWLFDFQAALVDWAVRQGRGAILADTGLGKSRMELAWAHNVVRRTSGRVLLMTPLAVGAQIEREAHAVGLEVFRHAAPGGPGIYITNYERLHHYDSADFVGAVGDESGILKSFEGKTRAAVTEFLRPLRYRLLASATPAPNDTVELGTTSEALGHLGYVDMLGRFFKNDQNTNTSDSRRKWAAHSGGGARWRFRGHAELPFWRWVTSWARAARRPSDVGPFDDSRFVLPPLDEREHVVGAMVARPGELFPEPARGLAELREERKRTLAARCEAAAALVASTGAPALCWAATNDEADRLEDLIAGAVQVSGKDSDEAKEEKFAAFESGQARVLVTKHAIGAWGLNWQHCAHQTAFASYSFEQYYQGVRRSWRFGQTRPVVIDNVVSAGEGAVLAARQRKAAQADEMFTRLVAHMRDGLAVERGRYGDREEVIPSWL